MSLCLKCESGSSRFQLGEGPRRGLLRDYESSDGASFQALVERGRAWGHQEWAGAGVVRGLTYNYSTPNVVTK